MWLDDVRAVIRDLVLSTPCYFKPMALEPDSPEGSTNHVTCVASKPETRWPTGRPETIGRHVTSGQVTEEGLGVPCWGVNSEGTPCSSDDLSDLPYVGLGFDWSEPPELGQGQFNWGSCPTSNEDPATTAVPPVVPSSCSGSFCPCPASVAAPVLSVSTPNDGSSDETTLDDPIPPTLFPPEEEGGTPASPDDVAHVDSSSDLLLTPAAAGTVQDLRWCEGEWMDVFDGRRLTESAMNLFPAFAFSP